MPKASKKRGRTPTRDQRRKSRVNQLVSALFQVSRTSDDLLRLLVSVENPRNAKINLNDCIGLRNHGERIAQEVARVIEQFGFTEEVDAYWAAIEANRGRK